ncbi:MAG: hypothetical protein AB7U79_00175 [Candidatus Izemoplasmatales bacterium]
MDIFMKVVLALFGLFFAYVGYRMFIHPKAVINGIQKYKYKTTQEPRKNEIIFSKILGLLLILFGLYFFLLGFVSIFN